MTSIVFCSKRYWPEIHCDERSDGPWQVNMNRFANKE